MFGSKVPALVPQREETAVILLPFNKRQTTQRILNGYS